MASRWGDHDGSALHAAVLGVRSRPAARSSTSCEARILDPHATVSPTEGDRPRRVATAWTALLGEDDSGEVFAHVFPSTSYEGGTQVRRAKVPLLHVAQDLRLPAGS